MPRTGLLLGCYTLTIFLSAVLLFLIQPMFARMVLPLLGGSPAVWNTAMVFYQAVLLGGYAYAHFATARLGVPRQAVWHLPLLAAPLLAVPIQMPGGWTPPVESNPVPWLLGLLTVAVGLPFFVVSTSSPLLQRWFAATGHPAARDPYFLYAASNLGSLLGLLSYPTLIEPALTLQQQGALWSWGYGLLALLTIGCCVLLRRGKNEFVGADNPTGSRADEESGAPIPSRRKLRWVALAFVPSSLLLSVTTYLTSDIAAVPLLWVVPLSLYLVTFIMVFARRVRMPQGLAQRMLPLTFLPVVMAIATGSTTPIPLLMALHLAAFTVAGLVCHGELARDRPAPGRLTEFYLWISVGGVLGGAFNALLAPLLFDRVLEYDLMLVAAAFLGGFRIGTREGPSHRAQWLDYLLPAALAALTAGLVRLVGISDVDEPRPIQTAVVFGVPLVFCFLMSRRRVRFALGLGAVLLVHQLAPTASVRVVLRERSFFGIHRVTRDTGGRFHYLIHGKTVHGMLNLEEARPRTPLTYYHPTGPAGQLFAALGDRLPGPVAAVGLGTGALAAYGRAGQEWFFYEIDPVVKRIAVDPGLFSFLPDSAAKVGIKLGDARLSLQRTADARFGLIVLDAYSSDSIPVHLITREAVRLYRDKLAPGGLLLFHASNLHLDLGPVLTRLAEDAGLAWRMQDDSEVSDEETAAGKTPSIWIAMARDAADFGPLATDPRWQGRPARIGPRVWTDDHSSVFSVFNWRLK
jgi:hypothetical protein